MNSITGAEQFEPETIFEKDIDGIKADHMKNIPYLDRNISSISSNKHY